MSQLPTIVAYSRTPNSQHSDPQHNRLLGITNPVNSEFFSPKSVLNSEPSLKIVRNGTLTAAWISIAAINIMAFDAIEAEDA